MSDTTRLLVAVDINPANRDRVSAAIRDLDEVLGVNDVTILDAPARDLLGQPVRYTNTVGLEQTGTLVGVVDEPSYVIARAGVDEDLIVDAAKVKDLRAR